ncbi:hypothetical protein Pres01_41330 [Metapseudomonas resinovorans]|uniref:hypothetical protein n=1 Tax=Metapseudomonas resinovorans TaxID=53412 RepID=UPI000986767F|nr:hypothetical protein [Pseudomonas resinovorans]GLZ88082.1 hypothetical protein Pres01_41330 [Pseudomonas resinovorans]
MSFRRWRPRDFLYYLHCQGEDVESAKRGLAHQYPDYRELTMGHFEIALVAATDTEARQVLHGMRKHCGVAHPIGQRHWGRHHFTALGLNQNWPRRRFDELHWLNTTASGTTPWERLSESADTVHIHHFAPPGPVLQIPARHYQWRSRQDLVSFWASLYLAREGPCIPGLDWSSYANWSTGASLGHASVGRGATPAAAVAALLAQTEPAVLGNAVHALLVIEANHSLTLGDYASILELLGTAIGCEVIATGYLSANYADHALRLLAFGPG